MGWAVGWTRGIREPGGIRGQVCNRLEQSASLILKFDEAKQERRILHCSRAPSGCFPYGTFSNIITAEIMFPST